VRSLLLVTLLAACSGKLELTDPPSGGPDGPDGGDGADSRAMFDSEVEPLLARARPKGACIGCHQGTDAVNGPDYLGPDSTTHYETLRTNHVLGTSPETSLLLNKPDHVGNTWCRGTDDPYAGCTEDETLILADWILLEKG